MRPPTSSRPARTASQYLGTAQEKVAAILGGSFRRCFDLKGAADHHRYIDIRLDPPQ
jgi:hypothetical protein